MVTIKAAQVPDKPINFEEDYTLAVDCAPWTLNGVCLAQGTVYVASLASEIALKWDPAAFDGGSAILDYQIWYDNANGATTSGENWIIYKSAHTSDAHIIAGLISGNFYLFKVETRNAYGFSFFSDIVQVQAALPPDQPSAPVTEFVWASTALRTSGGDAATGTTKVTWQAPNSQGAAILSYTIWI